MAKWGHNIPSVLNPLGEICVNVTIPAHPDYVALFVRAVRILETNRIYERDDVNGANVKIVQDNWRNRTITPLIEALATGTGICGVDGECLAYPPFAGFVSYTPQNPYTQPDFVPDGYELPPFYINGMDNEHDLPNYERGDVIVNFGAINLDVGFELENAPQIQLCLEGSGVVELKLLAIAQGGVVVLTVDNPPDIFDILAGIINDDLLIVDLNQDIISLPPETATEIIQELTIETEGEHIVYITFLPILDDSLIPLRFGGGLRSIDLCGNIRPCGTPAPEPPPPLDGVTELKPQFRFTADCGMEYRLLDQNDEIVQDWQGVEGWVDNAAACFGTGDSMTPEEMSEAICNGLVCAAPKIGLMLASGVANSGTFDEDGNIVLPDDADGGASGVPVDDPATPLINENKAAKMGGAITITRALEKFFDKCDTLYGVINGTPATPEATAAQLLHNYFPSDEILMQVGVGDYYAHRAANNVLAFNSTDAIAQFMYCNGYNLNAFNKWLSDVSTNNVARQLVFSSLAEALSQEFWDSYFAQGASVPSTIYREASCEPIDFETLNLNMAGAGTQISATTNGVWKVGHRYLIKVSNTYADTDNPTLLGDGMYRIDTNTGVKTFNPLVFNFTGGVTTPTQAQVPYQSGHVYQFTVDKTNDNAAGIIRKDESVMVQPNRTGTLTVEITDLGQFAP